MSYCFNPSCPNPQNTNDGQFCLTCGSKLLLKQRYRAIRPIGQGGFGRTFLALDEDKPSRPRCVIKQFYPQAQGTSTITKAEELFNQEAMRLDELGKHPQIPELLAYCTQDSRQYLVQEFIDGQNLAQEITQNGVFNQSQIWELLNDLLPVLQFCHSSQVIHRDIKPENIIRRRNSDQNGQLVLVDFGASKVATSTAINRTGTSIGSPEYVAPEQIRGRAIFASDIFSLGVTCIYLLSGRSPFELYDINNDTWIWQQQVKSVSKDLSPILNKMLESIPARRYQTATQVLADLNKQSPPPLTPKTPVKQTPTPPPPPSTIISPSQSQVDLELEEMKTLFLKTNKAQKANSSPPSKSQPTTKSKIDLELEELKAKYGENNS